MMKTFEKQMKKVKGKNESYAIYLGKRDEVNEDKFINGKCDVIICYKSDHEKLTYDLEAKSKLVNDLQNELYTIHSDHKEEIKTIKDEYNAKLEALNKELSSKDLQIQEIKSKYDNEIANLKHQQTKGIAELKNAHSNEVFEAHDKFKNTLISLRMKDHNENTRFIKEFEDLNFIDKHTSKFDNIIKEMKESDEIKLLNIDEDFPKLQLNTSEVNELKK